jgi:hypothetical protein
MGTKLILIGCFLIFIMHAAAQSPNVFIMDGQRLLELKKKVNQKDKETLLLVIKLEKEADDLLNFKPVSVMDKTISPVSGNKHDYMSQAPYFWYDSTKPNGLPYMRRDGVRNPEINKITDHKLFSDLDNATRILSLAYYLTGNEKYAEKAASLLRFWFFNENTKMNPNLDYAQGIPGINNGRGIGIIESRSLTGIADAAGLLKGSNSWKDADMKSLQQWYQQYLNWLLTSKNGNDEHAAKNNHGTWYYVQAVDFALFTGNKSKALQLVEESKKRIDSQMNKEGKMQLELDRTNGLGYSTFNIRAWFDLAVLAEKVGVDLWNYKNSNGASLRTAVDWLMPYAIGEKAWQYQQISKYDKNEFYPILLEAAYKYSEPNYSIAAEKIKSHNTIMTDLLYRK